MTCARATVFFTICSAVNATGSVAEKPSRGLSSRAAAAARDKMTGTLQNMSVAESITVRFAVNQAKSNGHGWQPENYWRLAARSCHSSSTCLSCELEKY